MINKQVAILDPIQLLIIQYLLISYNIMSYIIFNLMVLQINNVFNYLINLNKLYAVIY